MAAETTTAKSSVGATSQKPSTLPFGASSSSKPLNRAVVAKSSPAQAAKAAMPTMSGGQPSEPTKASVSGPAA